MSIEFNYYYEITKKRMKQFASMLSETERRAYAAVEAYRLQRGGVSRVSELLEISPETVKRGREDIDAPERLPQSELLKGHIAGDPMNEDIIWTDLQPSTIVSELAVRGFSVPRIQ